MKSAVRSLVVTMVIAGCSKGNVESSTGAQEYLKKREAFATAMATESVKFVAIDLAIGLSIVADEIEARRESYRPFEATKMEFPKLSEPFAFENRKIQFSQAQTFFRKMARKRWDLAECYYPPLRNETYSRLAQEFPESDRADLSKLCSAWIPENLEDIRPEEAKQASHYEIHPNVHGSWSFVESIRNGAQSYRSMNKAPSHLDYIKTSADFDLYRAQLGDSELVAQLAETPCRQLESSLGRAIQSGISSESHTEPTNDIEALNTWRKTLAAKDFTGMNTLRRSISFDASERVLAGAVQRIMRVGRASEQFFAERKKIDQPLLDSLTKSEEQMRPGLLKYTFLQADDAFDEISPAQSAELFKTASATNSLSSRVKAYYFYIHAINWFTYADVRPEVVGVAECQLTRLKLSLSEDSSETAGLLKKNLERFLPKQSGPASCASIDEMQKAWEKHEIGPFFRFE